MSSAAFLLWVLTVFTSSSAMEEQLRARLLEVVSQDELSDLERMENPMDITSDPLDQKIFPVLVDENDPVMGPADAPLTVVVFSDFECSFCRRHEETLQKLAKEYEGLIRLVFKHYPLGFHKFARPAALAAEAARKQGKFWEMHGKLITAELEFIDYDLTAAELGLDIERFRKDLAAPETEDKVNSDLAMGIRCLVSGTPTTFVNGFKLEGALAEAKLKRFFSLALVRSYVLMLQGVPASKIYERTLNPGVGGPLAKKAQPPEKVSEQPKQKPAGRGFLWDENGLWRPGLPGSR